MSAVTRTEVFTDPNLCGHFFDPIDTWQAQLVIIMALDGLPMNRKQKRLFRKLTGRKYRTTLPELLITILLLMGRRSGKSVLTAFLALYEAYFIDHSQNLKPREIGTVQVVANDRRQARIILRYLEGLFDNSPVMKNAIIGRTSESLELDNGIVIQVATCSIRAVRGYTCIAVVAEEASFWRSDESANPDRDVINALMATMATIPTGKCFILTSPYAQTGYVYEIYREHFGQESNHTLVFQAPTQLMNPTILQSFFDAEEKRDPESYKSEILAMFRSGRSAFLQSDWIDACLTARNLDRPRSVHDRPYECFVDMSGGRSDSATLAIAHWEPESEIVIVDALRRWSPPFNVEAVVAEMSEIMSQYGLTSCKGDYYAAEINRQMFTSAGINYMRSEDSASEIYLSVLPLFSTAKIEAPDHPVLRRELTMLERRTRSSGKDLVTHPNSSHDDLANSICGAILSAWRSRGGENWEPFSVPLISATHDSCMNTGFEDGSLTDGNF